MKFKAVPKKFFFDRSAVLNAMDRRTNRALARFGAFVRRTAKSSMRRRKKSAAPGAPPSRHEGSLAKMIFFAYDPAAQTVVIGPVIYKVPRSEEVEATHPMGGNTVPALLETGGTARRGRRIMQYEPRPFMGPAFEKETEKLPEIWSKA